MSKGLVDEILYLLKERRVFVQGDFFGRQWRTTSNCMQQALVQLEAEGRVNSGWSQARNCKRRIVIERAVEYGRFTTLSAALMDICGQAEPYACMQPVRHLSTGSHRRGVKKGRPFTGADVKKTSITIDYDIYDFIKRKFHSVSAFINYAVPRYQKEIEDESNN